MKLLPYTKAACDKLKIVFHADDVDGEVAESIVSVLDEFELEGDARRLSSQGKAYRARYRVAINDRDGLVVEITPTRPDNTEWAMTWEYTPSHLLKADREQLGVIANKILGSDAQRLLSNSEVYEEDVAIDFPVDIADVAIESRDKSSCSTWGKSQGADSRLQTLYFGSWSSVQHQTAYDKIAELEYQLAKRSTAKLSDMVDKAKRLGPRLRIEDRQRLSRCPVPLHRLGDLREPFAGFHIYSFAGAREYLTDPLGKVTLALAKAMGLQSALKELPKAERERVRHALATSHVEWWDASVYTGAMTSVLKATGLFPAYAFDPVGRANSAPERRYLARKQRTSKRGARSSYFGGLDDEDDEDRE